jgi:uncharacterized protein YaiE (UPF0345 family)
VVAVLACVAFGSSLAQAQLRTWVSGVGDDANPCSRTAPCRTFAGAITKTAQNGEIDALDPHGFGAFTVNKSITVDGTGVVAGILASSTTGIIINLDPSLGNTDAVHTVRLRGLSLNGAATNSKTGIRGINIASTNFTDMKIILEDSVIDGFVNEGILWRANGGHLVVKNSTIRNNNGPGIKADSSGANLVHVTVINTALVMNGEGIRFEDNIRGSVANSTISNNTTNGAVVIDVTSPSVMQLDHTMISDNGQVGVLAGGAVTFGTAQLSDCMVIHNNVGLQINAGGKINSWGHNHVSVNTTNGSFSAPLLTEQ